MTDGQDVRTLKLCLKELISHIHITTEQLKVQSPPSQSHVFQSFSTSNVGVYTFTINTLEEEQLEALRERIQQCVDSYRTRLNKTCKQYLFEFLNQYHYDEEKKMFSSSLTMDSLRPFALSLRGASASIDAFTAAWDGKQNSVKDFIRNYPMFKDRPGLHGTTLLYSAARNNHMTLVRYLVEQEHCSVKAQNRQELEKALQTSNSSGNFSANPSAASTALHGACYYGHLDIVKYLIEHGADYFTRNQAGETPISNGLRWPDIRNFFQQFLILGYSQQSVSLPNEPLAEKKNSKVFDCIWEYKPFTEKQWSMFSLNESDELSRAMLVEPGQDNKQSVYLRMGSVLCKVSFDHFLKSIESKEKANKLSWVRCRGSSTWNFHLAPLWQIMIIQHRDLKVQDEPNLQALDIPRMIDHRFKLHLNSWYNSTAQITTQFEEAMNYRKKKITLKIDFISSDDLTFDLHEFTFSNEDNTIAGYIRWRMIFPSKAEHRFRQRVPNAATLSTDSKDRLQISQTNMNRFTIDDDDDDDDDDDGIQRSARFHNDENMDLRKKV
jgi:hypothetical protein